MIHRKYADGKAAAEKELRLPKSRMVSYTEVNLAATVEKRRGTATALQAGFDQSAVIACHSNLSQLVTVAAGSIRWGP